MRKGILGSIAALAIGAGSAWGQGPTPIAAAGGQSMPVMSGDVIPASGPNPTLMPPIAVGPPGDPQGLGPTAGLGPPPGPMYPMPGPYGAPMFQPPPAAAAGLGVAVPAATALRRGGGSMANTCSGLPRGNQSVPAPDDQRPESKRHARLPSTIQLVPGETIEYGAIAGFRLSAGSTATRTAASGSW